MKIKTVDLDNIEIADKYKIVYQIAIFGLLGIRSESTLENQKSRIEGFLFLFDKGFKQYPLKNDELGFDYDLFVETVNMAIENNELIGHVYLTEKMVYMLKYFAKESGLERNISFEDFVKEVMKIINQSAVEESDDIQ